MEQFPNSLSSGTVTTHQVSFCGFDGNISAKDLTEFLEREIGMVWRCRLKTSWTPPGSHPNFDIVDTSRIKKTKNYKKVKPHAFVQFVLESAAKMALELASRGELVFDGYPLEASEGRTNSYRIATRRSKTNPFRFPGVTVEIGSMLSQNELLVNWKGPESKVDFEVDPFEGNCRILFTRETAFSLKNSIQHTMIECNFKMEFHLRDIKAFKMCKDRAQFALLLYLGASPQIHYRTTDDDISVKFDCPLLGDDDLWIRTTDVTSSKAIGRCDTYRISLPRRLGPTLNKVMGYFKECQIIEEQPNISSLNIRDDFETKIGNFFFSVQKRERLSFQEMFLVTALVHEGIVSQHQLSKEFFDLLRCQSELMNTVAIRHIYSCKGRLFNPSERLKDVQQWLLENPHLLQNPKISDHKVEMRRFVITPTRAYCIPPQLELSNRVLREFKNVADRFLRVTFMDEGFQQLNNNALYHYFHPIVKDNDSFFYKQRTNIFKRVKKIVSHGFPLCGRKYAFLGFSSNQLKDSSAWFFAEEEGSITVDSIRAWMGKFDNRNVAKYTARMGQCFSSTSATVDIPAEVAKTIPDIKRNGYVFSDGIGKITPALGTEIAEKLQLTVNPPSAYQIRYAGCKGVVACWPEKRDDKTKLFWRDSMKKFESTHTMLEVVSWSRYQPGFLNREIITLLSSLGVQDDIFSKMQDSMIFRLNQMLENTEAAFEVLTVYCAKGGNAAAIMLSAGFNPQTEPYLRGMLSCIRLAQLGGLLNKSRIFVPKSRRMIGVLDEHGELEHGQCFIQVSSHGSGISETNRKVKVITGTVAIAKNPCLHPGDIRILEAVYVSSFHYLVDCLVFPQKGDRPHANEASGSDLDGDDYFVTWDENLLPPSRMSERPMDYTPAEPKLLQRDVESKDIINFFTDNMVSSSLGSICTAYVVQADLSESGAQDEKCKKLAHMAAMAVDFPKTGVFVTMDHNLKPKVFPDFMEKDESISYKSEKILGKLYRDVKNFCPEQKRQVEEISEAIPYDPDLDIPGSEGFISEAWNNKCIYDKALNTLLGQFKVDTETEVVVGHFWSMPKFQSKKLGEIKKKLQDAYTTLNKEFRSGFEKLDPGAQEQTEDERNELYEQKASAWYKVTYHPQWIKKAEKLRGEDGDGAGSSTRLGFAWIAMDYLVRIKNKI